MQQSPSGRRPFQYRRIERDSGCVCEVDPRDPAHAMIDTCLTATLEELGLIGAR